METIDVLLITVDDIKAVRPTADLDPERVEPYIREAQGLQLRAVFNDAFWYDFVTKYDNMAGGDTYTNYQLLYTGGKYTVNGIDHYFSGIKPMLAYWTLVGFCSNPNNITRYGITKKTPTNSEPITPEELRILIANLKDYATKAQLEVEGFLGKNLAKYPLYTSQGRSENSARRTGLNFFVLGKRQRL